MLTVASATNATLASLLIGGVAVNASNYTYIGGTLTILSTYLAGLAAGVKTFTLTMSDGTTATVTITVTA